MNRVWIAFARFLAAIGLARHTYHVDSGAMLHIVARVTDGNSGQPLGGAIVSVERPPEGNESQPYRLPAGSTDPAGNFDGIAMVRWSHELTDIYTQRPDPPAMKIIIEKSGYHTREIGFVIQTLPVDSAQVAQLAVGAVFIGDAGRTD